MTRIGGSLSTAFTNVNATTGSINNGTRGFVDGDATAARFRNMYGVAASADGTLYVADTHNHAIRRVDGITGETTTLAGEVSTIAGTGSAGNADGVGASAAFRDPFDVAVNGSGNVFVSDSANHQIRHIYASTRAVRP